jgi:hypothetical protein
LAFVWLAPPLADAFRTVAASVMTQPIDMNPVNEEGGTAMRQMATFGFS